MQSINIKKYTKDQMAKMVEEAQAEVTALEAEIAEMKNCIDEKNDLIAEYANLKAEMRRKNVALTEQIDQMNGEAITRENVIASLKADADVLRNKLTDTEAALGRANAELTYSVTEKNELNAKIKQLDGDRHYYKSRSDELDHYKNLLRNANEECARIRAELEKTHCDRDDWEQRSVWQFNHPWRNLWAWVKRKLRRE